ncbi:MAG UNVERIFIED_CONTAM: hypothetical protein LVR18_42930 [Planctomycetaceae bacterium]|jgi:hypothetical protein
MTVSVPGDKEAEAALSGQVVRLEHSQFIRRAVAIWIVQVKHVAMSGVVGSQPATVGFQLQDGDSLGQIQYSRWRIPAAGLRGR